MTPIITGRGRGRPPKDPDTLLHTFGLRLTSAEHDKLRALGGRKWVQRQLARVTNLKEQRT